MQRERKYFPVSFWYKERFLQSKRCRAEIERPVRAHASYGVKITTEGQGKENRRFWRSPDGFRNRFLGYADICY